MTNDFEKKTSLILTLFLFKILNKDRDSYFYFDINSNSEIFHSTSFNFTPSPESLLDIDYYYIARYLPRINRDTTLTNPVLIHQKLKTLYSNIVILKLTIHMFQHLMFSNRINRLVSEAFSRIAEENLTVIQTLDVFYEIFRNNSSESTFNFLLFPTYSSILESHLSATGENFGFISTEVLNGH